MASNVIKKLYTTIGESGKLEMKGYRCLTQHGTNIDVYHFYSIVRQEHIGSIYVHNGNQSSLNTTLFATDEEKQMLRKCINLE